MKLILIRCAERANNKSNIPWHYGFYKDILEPLGHSVDILDNILYNHSTSELVDIIIKNGYEMVGIGGFGSAYRYIKELTIELKKANNKIIIV
ncbi:MAG: hypothetical protein HQK93_08020, partial [Nitrospirae bacterium]|nr:hypothetical protein [Nitrospirota bacterium]